MWHALQSFSFLASTCRWKCLKDGKCCSTFLGSILQNKCFCFFWGVGTCVFFQPGVWHDCFFLKLNTNQMPFEIFITHYLGTFILMRPSPWVGSPCWGTSAMPETTDRNMRISTGNGHTEVRSGCHKSDGHQRLGRAQTGWRVEVSGGFRRNLLEVFFSFFCFLFLDFKLWIF